MAKSKDSGWQDHSVRILAYLWTVWSWTGAWLRCASISLLEKLDDNYVYEPRLNGLKVTKYLKQFIEQ